MSGSLKISGTFAGLACPVRSRLLWGQLFSAASYLKLEASACITSK